jgi:hypothetical protein
MPDAKKNDLVQIHTVILKPSDRADNLPSSTKQVPYECWIKGFLLNKQADKGDNVRIQTLIGRELTGTLYEVTPKYEHDFGTPQEVLLPIGNEAGELLKKNSTAKEMRDG